MIASHNSPSSLSACSPSTSTHTPVSTSIFCFHRRFRFHMLVIFHFHFFIPAVSGQALVAVSTVRIRYVFSLSVHLLFCWYFLLLLLFQEYAALASFYLATGSTLDWELDGQTSICSWSGITCADSGTYRVTRM